MFNNIPWAEFLEFVDDTDILSYADKHGNYYLFHGQLVCVLDKHSADAEDFETNYQADATILL